MVLLVKLCCKLVYPDLVMAARGNRSCTLSCASEMSQVECGHYVELTHPCTKCECVCSAVAEMCLAGVLAPEAAVAETCLAGGPASEA